MTAADILGPVTLAPAFTPRTGDLVHDTATDQVAPVVSVWRPETGGALRAYLQYPCGKGGRFVPVSRLRPLSGSIGGAG